MKRVARFDATVMIGEREPNGSEGKTKGNSKVFHSQYARQD